MSYDAPSKAAPPALLAAFKTSELDGVKKETSPRMNPFPNAVVKFNRRSAEAFVKYHLPTLVQLHPTKGWRYISRKRVEAAAKLGRATFPQTAR